MSNLLTNKHKAAVSLFVVIFATLLITVVTVSFARLMVKSQQQATTIDLSQSAYDSALAGVEDAKRALLTYKNICQSAPASPSCVAATSAINGNDCNDPLSILSDLNESNGEIDINTTGDDNRLDQSYTCVKINLETNDYLGSLSKDESKLISLSGISSFSKIKIQWFNNTDASRADGLITPSAGSVLPLRRPSNWGINNPPILRAQLIQFNSTGFNLTDFNNDQNVNTLFLYPSAAGGIDTKDFLLDQHTEPENRPQLIACNSSFSSEGYACSVTISINGAMNNKFLRLSSFYNHTNYRIVLLNNLNQEISFNGVQPEIDSTGRTNDMFRRVKSRVELNTDFPYPEATIDITGNLCKDFIVTNNVDHYSNNCTP